MLENILLTRGARQIAERLRDVTEPSQVADLAGYSQDLSLAQKVQVLETLNVEERLRLVLGWARDTLADLTLRQQIKSSVEEGMEKTQREFLLRRQLEAIRKELGELEGNADDGTPEHYRSLLAGRELPEAVRNALEREITKLERMSEQSPEQGWVRTYIETVLEIPWGVTSEDRLDVNEAARVLDEDHDGLKDVKERILEHLAVRACRPSAAWSPSAVVEPGPPWLLSALLAWARPLLASRWHAPSGVSLSASRSVGCTTRPRYAATGGPTSGRSPDGSARALREAGTMNPVIVLDEVDKVGSDYRGDPSSALLEVLDPAQNHTFRDHYLEIELDLSKVLFIATANVTETVPGPLLDRMEVIRIDGYTEDEKLAIARHHLLPRQLERAALRPDEVEVTDEALRRVSADYTREAGVRNLERELGRVMRKVATKLAAASVVAPVVVDADDVVTWLGRPRFFFEAADRTSVPGVATGLAVTGTGGDVLFIEATVMDGPEGLTLTGQLGDVMKESAEIALSHVRAHAKDLGINEDAFRGKRFHVHGRRAPSPRTGRRLA